MVTYVKILRKVGKNSANLKQILHIFLKNVEKLNIFLFNSNFFLNFFAVPPFPPSSGLLQLF